MPSSTLNPNETNSEHSNTWGTARAPFSQHRHLHRHDKGSTSVNHLHITSKKFKQSSKFNTTKVDLTRLMKCAIKCTRGNPKSKTSKGHQTHPTRWPLQHQIRYSNITECKLNNPKKSKRSWINKTTRLSPCDLDWREPLGWSEPRSEQTVKWTNRFCEVCHQWEAKRSV